MAILAMLLLTACDTASNSTSDIIMEDVQLENIQSAPEQLSRERIAIQLDSVNDQNKFFNTEDYDHIIETKFLAVKQEPLSTFSSDADRAAYSNVRRFIESGQLPPIKVLFAFIN